MRASVGGDKDAGLIEHWVGLGGVKTPEPVDGGVADLVSVEDVDGGGAGGAGEIVTARAEEDGCDLGGWDCGSEL